MQTIQCPKCHSDVIIEDGLSRNDLVSCTNCGVELEITSLHPLLVKFFSEADSADHASNDSNQQE
jgi:lysine biosynthesis protein LysW